MTSQSSSRNGKPFLDRDALAGRTVAVSVSESPDLGRLGVTENHLRMTLGEIARAVFVAGGGLAYGGDLREDGYTRFLVDELMRWQRLPGRPAEHDEDSEGDDPGTPADAEPSAPRLQLCLAWTVHRKYSVSQVHHFVGLSPGSLKVVCLSPDGEEDRAWSRHRDQEPEPSPQLRSVALTGMREWMTRHTDARVLVGGQRAGFGGTYPGLMEEALLSVQVGHPLYLAGGFGGVALDIIRALGADMPAVLPPWGGEQTIDDRLRDGFEALQQAAAGRGWAALNNGLTDEENHVLALTPRPSEIAALVSRGVGLRTRQE